MMIRKIRIRHALRALGFAVVMLALASRLASGMAVVDMRALDDITALLAAAAECQPDAGPDGHHGTPLKPGPDQGVATAVSVLALAVPLLTPTLAIPVPRSAVLAAETRLPPSHAPPARQPGAALPRGPPVLT